MFHHFGWKLPIQGHFLDFGGKLASDFNFSFYNPQNAHTLRDSASFEPSRVKIRLLYVGPRKKIN